MSPHYEPPTDEEIREGAEWIVSGGAAGAADTAGTLVQTVREALGAMRSAYLCNEPITARMADSAVDALTALSALAVRVEAAERERGEARRMQSSAHASSEMWRERAVAAEARLLAATDALRLISLSDGANAPAGVPTAEYLRSIARAVLVGGTDE